MEVVRVFTKMHASLRRSALLLGLLSAIIFGLLAMHSLSTSAAHNAHEAGASPTVTHVMHEESATLAVDTQPSDAPTPDHSALMVSCVLALLAGTFMALAPLLTGASWRVRFLAFRSLTRTGKVLLRARAPSLIFLSISRT